MNDLYQRLPVLILGALIVFQTVRSAISTFVVPRGEPVRLTRLVFGVVRFFYKLRADRVVSYPARDRVMASYAATSLLILLPVWLALVLVGYAAMYWGLGIADWTEAFRVSGSALLTLNAEAQGLIKTVLMFTEATVGLTLLALLISYLPSMYAAFQRRESLVTMLEVRAGTPPSVVEMLARYQRLHGLDRLHQVWEQWEVWFAEVEESHTSLGALIFFRSPDPNRSWLTAAGVVLDTGAFTASTLDIPRDPQQDLCIRAGYLALRHVADLLHIAYDRNPKPTDPISINRKEYDEVCEELLRRGLPLKQDREQAWRDFVGWRVNYDTVLLAIAGLTMAPYAPWVSDRSPIGWRLREQRRKANSRAVGSL